MLYANVGNIKDLGIALQNDAGGIGLFRSEFIYLGQDHYPTEEEQFQIYKTVAETMAGRRVIIVHWISVLTSSAITLNWTKRTILQWGSVPSVSV